mmetsp:Transcript_35654/g.112471  ORF Transcript_35654/g.112471 Transcript_35654/m.112471 type:complete len:341 (-) Transcript_35654:3-1025(-)
MALRDHFVAQRADVVQVGHGLDPALGGGQLVELADLVPLAVAQRGLSAVLDELGEGHGAVVRYVEVRRQPRCHGIHVGQSRGHPHDLRGVTPRDRVVAELGEHHLEEVAAVFVPHHVELVHDNHPEGVELPRLCQRADQPVGLLDGADRHPPLLPGQAPPVGPVEGLHLLAVAGLNQRLEVRVLLVADGDEGEHEKAELVGRAQLAEHEDLPHEALARARRRAVDEVAALDHPVRLQAFRLPLVYVLGHLLGGVHLAHLLGKPLGQLGAELPLRGGRGNGELVGRGGCRGRLLHPDIERRPRPRPWPRPSRPQPRPRPRPSLSLKPRPRDRPGPRPRLRP